MTATSDFILELKNITKVFDYDLFKKKETAVQNVSICLERSKCTGLLGHNGAGKTTSIKMILGLIKPTKGSIRYNSEEFSRTCLREIGYMPEINKLSANLTPFETLDYQMRLFNFKPPSPRKNFIIEKLASVGLANHMYKKNKSLSKGQGRRLGFAYATIHEPKLLILDEPFSGLDPIGRDFMLTSIENLRGMGSSILLCSHEVEVIKRLCDDVVILREGEKVYDSREANFESKAGVAGKTQYQLVLSGIGPADIENLLRDQELPVYQEKGSRGYLHNLLFEDFEHANAWLRAATASGILVLEFKELRNSFGDNEDLLQYLRRENVK